MQVIIYGDKSRYEFLKSLIIKENIKDLMSNEYLSRHDVYLTSCRDKNKSGVYHSGLVPFNMELIFPSEFRSLELNYEDRILFFEDFPYRNDDTRKLIIKILQDCKVNKKNCMVIIVENRMRTLETDITNMEEAVQSAIREYEAEGIKVEFFSIGESNDFLFDSIDVFSEKTISDLVEKKLLDAKEELEKIYELKYELDKIYLQSEFKSAIPVLYDYDKKMSCNAVIKVLEQKITNYLWGNEKSRGSDFVRGFYYKMVVEFLGNMCMWDIDNDVRRLIDNIRVEFSKCFEVGLPSEYAEDVFEYEILKDKNRLKMNILRNNISDFFDGDSGLRKILFERINKRIEGMRILSGGRKI